MRSWSDGLCSSRVISNGLHCDADSLVCRSSLVNSPSRTPIVSIICGFFLDGVAMLSVLISEFTLPHTHCFYYLRFLFGWCGNVLVANRFDYYLHDRFCNLQTLFGSWYGLLELFMLYVKYLPRLGLEREWGVPRVLGVKPGLVCCWLLTIIVVFIKCIGKVMPH